MVIPAKAGIQFLLCALLGVLCALAVNSHSFDRPRHVFISHAIANSALADTVVFSGLPPLLQVCNTDWSPAVCSSFTGLPLSLKSYWGLSLNGSGYASGGGAGIYNTPVTVLKVVFYPNFAITDGLNRLFVDTNNVARYGLYKTTASKIALVLSGTANFLLSGASPASWVASGRNVLTISLDTNTNVNSMTLNGATIASNTTDWTPANHTNFYLGANYAGAGNFSGIIESVTVHSDLAQTIKTAEYLFNGNYNDTAGANDLAAAGSGNAFAGGSGNFKIFHESGAEALIEDPGSLLISAGNAGKTIYLEAGW